MPETNGVPCRPRSRHGTAFASGKHPRVGAFRELVVLIGVADHRGHPRDDRAHVRDRLSPDRVSVLVGSLRAADPIAQVALKLLLQGIDRGNQPVVGVAERSLALAQAAKVGRYKVTSHFCVSPCSILMTAAPASRPLGNARSARDQPFSAAVILFAELWFACSMVEQFRPVVS